MMVTFQLFWCVSTMMFMSHTGLVFVGGQPTSPATATFGLYINQRDCASFLPTFSSAPPAGDVTVTTTITPNRAACVSTTDGYPFSYPGVTFGTNPVAAFSPGSILSRTTPRGSLNSNSAISTTQFYQSLASVASFNDFSMAWETWFSVNTNTSVSHYPIVLGVSDDFASSLSVEYDSTSTEVTISVPLSSRNGTTFVLTINATQAGVLVRGPPFARHIRDIVRAGKTTLQLYVSLFVNVSYTRVVFGELCSGFLTSYTASPNHPNLGASKLRLDSLAIFPAILVPRQAVPATIQTPGQGVGIFIQSAVYSGAASANSILSTQFARMSSEFPRVLASVRTIPILELPQGANGATNIWSTLMGNVLNFNPSQHEFVVTTLPTRGSLYSNSSILVSQPNTVVSSPLYYIAQDALAYNLNVTSAGLSALAVQGMNVTAILGPHFDRFGFIARERATTFTESVTQATCGLYVVDQPDAPSVVAQNLSNVRRDSNTLITLVLVDPDDAGIPFSASRVRVTGGIPSLQNSSPYLSNVAVRIDNNPQVQPYGRLLMGDCITPITTNQIVAASEFASLGITTPFTFCYVPRITSLNMATPGDVFQFSARDASGTFSAASTPIRVQLVNPLTTDNTRLDAETNRSITNPIPVRIYAYDALASTVSRQIRVRIISLPQFGTLSVPQSTDQNAPLRPAVQGDEILLSADGVSTGLSSLFYTARDGYFNFVRYGTQTLALTANEPFLSFIPTIIAARRTYADVAKNRVYANLLDNPIDGCIGMRPFGSQSCRCSRRTVPGCPDTFQFQIVTYLPPSTVAMGQSEMFDFSLYVAAIPTAVGQVILNPTTGLVFTRDRPTLFTRSMVTYVDPDDDAFLVALSLNPSPGKLAWATNSSFVRYMVPADGRISATAPGCKENGCDIAYRVIGTPSELLLGVVGALSFIATSSLTVPDTGASIRLVIVKPRPYGTLAQTIATTTIPADSATTILEIPLTVADDQRLGLFGSAASFLNSPLFAAGVSLGLLSLIIVALYALYRIRQYRRSIHDAQMVTDDPKVQHNDHPTGRPIVRTEQDSKRGTFQHIRHHPPKVSKYEPSQFDPELDDEENRVKKGYKSG